MTRSTAPAPAAAAAALALAAVLVAAAPAAAREAVPLARDPVVEQRMISITKDLRCLVCQNESLAASQADLAQDLRNEVRELVRQGKSDKEIIRYLVARYGNFVRYEPPFEADTWLLWLGPFALLAVGTAGLLLHLRRRARTADAPLAPEDLARARALLGDTAPEETR